MKQKLSILIAIIMQSALAQPVKWLKTFGEADQACAGRGVWQAPDSSLYLLGSRQLATGEYDALLTKTTQNGILIWQKTLGISGYDFANSFVHTPAGQFAVLGVVQKGFSGISNNFFARVDTSGIVLDLRQWGDSIKNENLTHLTLLPDGGFICAGIRSQDDLASNDAYLARLDPTGQVLWERNYGGPGNEVGHAVVAVADGFVFSSDEYRGTTIIQGFPYTDYNVTLTKTDFDGNIIWKTEIGDNNVNGNIMMHTTHFGDFLLVGESTTPTGPAFDIFTARVAASGTLQWIRYIGGEGTDTGFALTETDDHHTLVAGYTNSYSPNLPIQMHITRLDSSGKAIDTEVIYNQGISLAYGIERAKNGHYLVVGTSNDRIALAAIADTAFSDTFYTNTTFLSSISGPAATLVMQASPNPASGLVHLRLPEGFLPNTLTISDIQGKSIITVSLHAGHETDLSGLAPGLYFLHARDAQGRTAVCRVAVE